MRSYLDHAATTPLRPEVAEFLANEPVSAANPAAQHTSGRAASAALAQARARLAACLDADAHEVLFTSCGTEADALVVAGRVLAVRATGVERPVLVLSALEHPAVADTARTAEAYGAEVRVLPLTHEGITTPESVVQAVQEAGLERVALVSVMAASNEIGTIQDLARIVDAVRSLSPSAHPGEPGWVPVHSDAVAALSDSGCQSVPFRSLGLDALSLSGHKFGAPVGTGALVLRREITLVAPTGGGRQERGLRSGTQDVRGAQALALALELACADREREMRRLEELRTLLLEAATAHEGVHATVPSQVPHLPGTAHLWCEHADGEALLMALDMAGIDASAGSACHAGVWQPSEAMLAMGYSEDQARSALRLTLGRITTRSDIDRFLEVFPAALEAARRSWAVRHRH